ncbi:DEAD/DEAH box helicase [Arcanobacterium phocae]|uniref:DEAD/DEAH box helicase n=1 Tax=Arcanobacterium phocae TaxID=131112 RepID=UPI001C0EE50C
MSIDRAQASSVITSHQANLRLVQELDNSRTAAITSMHTQVQAKMATYQQIYEHELFGPTSTLPASSDETLPDTGLLVFLAITHQLQPLITHTQRIDATFGKQISAYINDLSPATGRLRWFFANSAKKALAEEAFRQLDQLAQGPLATEYAEIRQDYQRILLTDPDTAREDFESHREAYQQTFEAIYEDPIEAKPPRLQRLEQRLHEVDNYQTLVDYHCTTIAQQISQDVTSLRERSAQESLKEITLDSLRVDIERLRVKTLAEAGYRNAYDIYQASSFQLAMIPGISETVADELVTTATRYLHELEKNTNIRIDPDQRTPESSAVIATAYQYLRLTHFGDALKRLHDSLPASVQKNIPRIRQLSAPGWALLDTTQKREIREAVDYLATDYFTELDDLTRGFPAPQELVDRPSLQEAWADFIDNSIEYYNLLERLVPGILGTSDSAYGLPDELAEEISSQELNLDGLKCSLRRYQEWGAKYVLNQQSVILGDEMGLGKTVQALAVMVTLHNMGQTHFMVVCPAAVLINWMKEISSKSNLPVVKLHGKDRDLSFAHWLEHGGVAVTTFETTKRLAFPDHVNLGMLVVDEAHYVKNPEAQRTKALMKILGHTQRHLLMTGTALENRVDEMITLVRMLRADIAQSLTSVAHMMTADIFREKVAPVYLRRKREDVLGELPQLIENEEWCELNRPEWLAYEESAQRQSFVTLRRVSWNVSDLRYSQKAQRLKEIVERARSDNRKVIVFSYFLDTIAGVQRILGDSCFGPINGSVTPEHRQEIIDEFDDADAGSVLVAQVQAGGTGLNIQAASVVVFCEPQLKPSIENQAISRAYRMGQARNVMVYRLLSEHSIDERIMEILGEKQAVFDSFADESVAAQQQATENEQLEASTERTIEIDTRGQNQILRAELERIQSDDSSMFAPRVMQLGC